MSKARNPFRGRLLVVAFEGWNDAGEAASSAVTTLQEQLNVIALHTVDPETYIPEFLSKLKDAGSEDIIAEKQKQLDAWLAGKK